MDGARARPNETVRPGELTRRRFVGVALLAPFVAAVGSAGCAAIAGEHDAETEFLIAPGGDGTFFGWSEITISQRADSVDSAVLQFVVLEVIDPPGTPDLTFISEVVGEAVTPDGRTVVVRRRGMPKNEPSVALDIEHRGDLRSFFADGHTIRIEWRGSVNQRYPFPDGGIRIRVALRVVVD